MKYTINELANSKGVSQPVREALLHMEAELEATNRQVEILSDALAESRREVAALKVVQEPLTWLKTIETPGGFGKFVEAKPNEKGAKPVYLAPPAAPVQDLPFGVGGGLVAIKTLLSRDPCVHANTAIEMIDAILKEHPAAQRQWVGLTQEEFRDFATTFEYGTGGLIRAIEDKLRSKNNG
jgi:hypothetical protein